MIFFNYGLRKEQHSRFSPEVGLMWAQIYTFFDNLQTFFKVAGFRFQIQKVDSEIQIANCQLLFIPTLQSANYFFSTLPTEI
jgi:hypothetical protein